MCLLIVSGLLAACCAVSSDSSAAKISASARSYRVVQSLVPISILQSAVHSINVLVEQPAGHGPFPLVVFSPGYGADAQEYASVLRDIARAGYVVAGPNFSTTQVVEQAQEVNDVIDRLASSSSRQRDRLIDPRRVAVMGHSLGGMTTYLLGYNSCCRARRAKAVITIEGAEFGVPNGHFTWRGAPLLIVLGNQDPVIPPWIGRVLLSRFSTAAYLLTIIGGNHGGGMDNDDPVHPVVMKTILRFLDAYLRGNSASLRELRSQPNSQSTSLTQVHTHRH